MCIFARRQKRARKKKELDDARAYARSEGRVIAREGRDTARNIRAISKPTNTDTHLALPGEAR